jgi:hypothetical protein
MSETLPIRESLIGEINIKDKDGKKYEHCGAGSRLFGLGTPVRATPVEHLRYQPKGGLASAQAGQKAFRLRRVLLDLIHDGGSQLRTIVRMDRTQRF